MKVLIVEDSPEVAESVSLCLQLRWPDVSLSVASEGLTGLDMARSIPFDMVILDINLPDIDGFQVIRELRPVSNVPIIMLTVRDDEQDQTMGLEIGADDYIVKPFRPRDLIARVNAVLRRTQGPPITAESPFVVRGKLTLNLTTDEAFLRGQAIKLTPTESRLLYTVMINAEQTISPERLYKDVWGEGFDIQILRSGIRRLRDRLRDDPPKIIITERGEGYRFVSPS